MGIAFLLRALVLGGIVVAGAPATAKPIPVDLELVLAVDVSGSIDDDEARMQRQGYVAAFANASVVGAITSGFLGRIAVTYFDWAGFGYDRIVVDWTLIDGVASARAFSRALARPPLVTARRTSISEAIDYAVPLFGANDFAGTRRVIDISGDGPNNYGHPVTLARNHAVAAGITINGLPIVNDRPSRFGWPPIANLDLYYRECVIGGRSAFMVVAQDFTDFARAIRKKLILEIAGRTPADPPRAVRSRFGAWAPVPRPVRPVAERVPPPCDIGERRWERLIDDF